MQFLLEYSKQGSLIFPNQDKTRSWRVLSAPFARLNHGTRLPTRRTEKCHSLHVNALLTGGEIHVTDQVSLSLLEYSVVIGIVQTRFNLRRDVADGGFESDTGDDMISARLYAHGRTVTSGITLWWCEMCVARLDGWAVGRRVALFCATDGPRVLDVTTSDT